MGRIAGVEVRIDSSWVVIALLITYSMYLRFSILYRNLSTTAAVGVALLAAVLFFGSVLKHELAHALFSRARGIRVQDFTLFLFGGATRARVESRGPGDEFLIAVVGPLTSGLLAALFWAVEVSARGALPRPLIGMFGYLTWVNLLLAGFNLVPGFPLDGGRRKIRQVPSDQWAAGRVRDHMAPLGNQVLVPLDAPMDQVMAKLEDGGAGRVLTVEDGEVVGIITSSDLTRWLRRWRVLDSRALDSEAR